MFYLLDLLMANGRKLIHKTQINDLCRKYFVTDMNRRAPG